MGSGESLSGAMRPMWVKRGDREAGGRTLLVLIGEISPRRKRYLGSGPVARAVEAKQGLDAASQRDQGADEAHLAREGDESTVSQVDEALQELAAGSPDAAQQEGIQSAQP